MRGCAIALVLIGCGPKARSVAGEGTGSEVDIGTTSTVSLGDAEVSGTGPAQPSPPKLPPYPDHCEDGILTKAWVQIGGDYDDREMLVGVDVIDGDLVINGADDSDLSFLSCIREVRGSLYLNDNDALTDVSGLAHVSRIGGDVVIANNDALVEFDSLTLLDSLEVTKPDGTWDVRHALVIVNNNSLETLSGLTNLATVPGHLQVRDNPQLTSVYGLRGLRTIGGRFGMVHNASLCISQVNAIGNAILESSTPGDDWSSIANREGC